MRIKSIVLLAAISLMFLISFVKIRVDQINTGYDILENNKIEKSLIQQRQRLMTELSQLKSPNKLEIIADKLGFRFPTQNDIFHIEKVIIVATENEKNKETK